MWQSLHGIVNPLAAQLSFDQAQGAIDLVVGVGGSLLLLLPGWVLTTVYNRGVKGPDLSDREFVTQMAFAGVLVHLLAAPWTVRVVQLAVSNAAGSWPELTAWGALVLIIGPAALGALLAWGSDQVTSLRPGWMRSVVTRFGVTTAVRTPYAWTWAFKLLTSERLVRVRLRDGTFVLGRLGLNSLAGSDPIRRDIYLEKVWSGDSDGWFHEPLAASEGIWLSGDDVVLVEFYRPKDEEALAEVEPTRPGVFERLIHWFLTIVRPAAAQAESSADRAESAAEIASQALEQVLVALEKVEAAAKAMGVAAPAEPANENKAEAGGKID
jgi:Family of unknown function (DUF6338)